MTTNFFLPRDAMRKRGTCCRPVFVRLSVRPTHPCIAYCIQTAENIAKPLLRPGRSIILVPGAHPVLAISKVRPSGGVK